MYFVLRMGTPSVAEALFSQTKTNEPEICVCTARAEFIIRKIRGAADSSIVQIFY